MSATSVARRRIPVRALLVVAAIGVSSATALQAQTVVRVVDADSIPIRYALVSLRGSEERVVDSLGYVRFVIAAGTSPRIVVRRLGYAPFSDTVPLNRDGEHIVVLEPVGRELAAVRTIAPRVTPLSRTGFYDRMERVQRGAIVGWFIPPEELDRRHISQLSRVLQGVGSVRVERRRDGKPVVTGRGGCGMTIVLDGQRLAAVSGEASTPGPTSLSGGQGRGGSLGGGMSIDEAIDGNSVMAIEVYPSLANAPDELIPLTGGGSCGLIAVWTGPRR